LSLRLEQLDLRRCGVFLLGAGLFAFSVSGALPSTLEATLLVVGVGLVAVALLLGEVKSIDFAGVFKGEFVTDDPAQATGVHTDEWKLRRFAWLVCGNADEARELVEEALAEARVRRVPTGERGTQELRSLVAMLENTRAHALLRRKPSRPRRSGHDGADELADEQCRATLEALGKLPVRVRVTYLLRCSWLLSVQEVAGIVSAEPVEVNSATELARQALAAV
jgi:DNA-directed RNA polymerase specialized sigma24 family protein